MSTTTQAPIAEEIQYRIEQQLQYFNGNMPEQYAAAWHGYLAGIFEWGTIDKATYFYLECLLPRLALPNPVSDIFVWMHDPEESPIAPDSKRGL